MIKDGENQLILQTQEIHNDQGSLIGTVIRITQLQDLQHFEMKTRKLISDKGFFAQHTFEDIKGISDEMVACINTARQYALSSSNVLIEGESGTGKELFAQSIHNSSRYQGGPFLAINCATVPESLLESELFGYEEGAFTGAAHKGKPGLFEMAHNGTLFLDEIGEMPYSLQAKLLRVLEERTVRRLGGDKNVLVNIRIVSATNRILSEEVLDKNFREDLYYRLNVLNLKIPPLRERKEDIPYLVKEFLAKLSIKEGRGITFPKSYIQVMQQYDWYGNGRELYNFTERVFVMSLNGRIPLANIQEMIDDMKKMNNFLQNNVISNDQDCLRVPVGTLREMEDSLMLQMYQRHNGSKEKLHKALDISLSTIWRRLKSINTEKNQK